MIYDFPIEMSLWFPFRNDKWDIPFGVPFDIPYRENRDIPLKMITYNFEMIKNDCLFEMSKSPYLVLKWYMTVILKWGVAVLCSFRDDVWLSFRNDGAKFWSRELFWSTNELSYEHKRAMVKRSQMEECSPIRAVFFYFFVTKIWNLSQQDIHCRTLIFVSKRTK